jgi:hypothetical protein
MHSRGTGARVGETDFWSSEHSGCIRGKGFLDRLSNPYVLKKGSARWNWCGKTEEDWSYFTADGRSVSQYVLVSNTLVGLATIYYFLSECCCLKFAVLYLLDALSEERTGLQFAV